MLPPNSPYLLLRRLGRDLVGVGHRDSPFLSPGTRLLLVPSLGFAVTGRLRPEGIDVKLLSGRPGTEDVLALPFGAAAYLDSKAKATLSTDELPGDTSSAEAMLLLAGFPLGPVRISGLILEAKRLLPWYSGLPYALRIFKEREYPISGVEPATSFPWSGRVSSEALETAATPAAVPGPEDAPIDVGGVLFPPEAYERLAAQAGKAARREGGVPRSAVHKALGPLQNPIRGPFVDFLLSRGRLKDLGDLLIENPPEKTLSPISRGVLRELDAAGPSGITLGDRPKGFRDAAFRLETMQLAVVVAGRLAWSSSGFSSAVKALKKRSRGNVEADDVAEYLNCSKTVAKDVLRRLADEGLAYSIAAGTAKWRHRGRR